MNDIEVIKRLKDIFEIKNFKGYDIEQEFDVSFEANEKLRDGRTKDVYIVSFWSIPIHFERDYYFAYLDKETEELLYIMTPSGYLDL